MKKLGENPLPYASEPLKKPVRMMYSLGRCHVVNSGNLCTAVNILLDRARYEDKPEFALCVQATCRLAESTICERTN